MAADNHYDSFAFAFMLREKRVLSSTELAASNLMCATGMEVISPSGAGGFCLVLCGLWWVGAGPRHGDAVSAARMLGLVDAMLIKSAALKALMVGEKPKITKKTTQWV